VSYFLDQSNDDLPDGTNYLQVTVSDGLAGLIDFTVETLAPLNAIAVSATKYGIDKFRFNTTLATPPITAFTNLPSGWTGGAAPPPISGDGFGDFELAVDGGRLTTLTFSLDAAGDSIFDYAELSTGGGKEGHVFFTAHVGGFTEQTCEGTSGPGGTCKSAYFGGTTMVPIPAAVWLFGSALGLPGWIKRREVE
jgi:hypothetical protein